MKVAEGFEVKLFAAEPMVVNPVAMTVDERGRVWVVECFEYPSRTPPGRMPRDRIVILEDTKGTGICDKLEPFSCEGKDFPSGRFGSPWCPPESRCDPAASCPAASGLDTRSTRRPTPGALVHGHGDRIDDHRLGREQLDLEPSATFMRRTDSSDVRYGCPDGLRLSKPYSFCA